MSLYFITDRNLIINDYQFNKTTGLVKKLQRENVHAIKHHKTDAHPIVYAVSEKWYRECTAHPASDWEVITISNLSMNAELFAYIVNGIAQTKELQRRINVEGPHNGRYKGYIIIDSAKYALIDDDLIQRGKVMARYISPTHFSNLPHP